MAQFQLIPSMGSTYTEIGEFFYQLYNTFRGIIKNREQVISGGASNNLTGKYIKAAYTGNVTGAVISAVAPCQMTVYRLDQGVSETAQIVFQGRLDAGQIAYSGNVQSNVYFLVEAKP